MYLFLCIQGTKYKIDTEHTERNFSLINSLSNSCADEARLVGSQDPGDPSGAPPAPAEPIGAHSRQAALEVEVGLDPRHADMGCRLILLSYIFYMILLG